MLVWNPWHGCHKISQGCKNCYVYSKDMTFGKDSSIVTKTSNFNLPLKKNINGQYKLTGGELIYTCITSDFFVEEADSWRKDAWDIIDKRKDLTFLIITKRADGFFYSLPSNWKDGYDNVIISCTVENQSRADYLLPIYLKLPIKHKSITCSPILERIDFSDYLNFVEELVVGGESGSNARVCDYDWILDIRNQCISAGIKFWFYQTGAKFRKNGKIYYIQRKFQHSQAQKANIDIL